MRLAWVMRVISLAFAWDLFAGVRGYEYTVQGDRSITVALSG